MKPFLLPLLLLLFFTACPAHAHVVSWPNSNDAFYDCITNFENHEFMNPLTKAFGCMAADHAGLTSLTITSGCDRKSFHHGKFCNAMDFYFEDYTGSNVDDFAKEYIQKFAALIDFLNVHPWVADRVSLGFYPSHCRNGRAVRGTGHIHFGARGDSALWGWIHGRQVTITEAVKAYREYRDGC